jgi:hypothetical protein
MGIENLESDLAVVLEIVREVHYRHATVPDLSVDGIAVL